MEALTYDRALAYKDEFPSDEYETWQPSKVMSVLFEIDPTTEDSSNEFPDHFTFIAKMPSRNLRLDPLVLSISHRDTFSHHRHLWPSICWIPYCYLVV